MVFQKLIPNTFLSTTTMIWTHVPKSPMSPITLSKTSFAFWHLLNELPLENYTIVISENTSPYPPVPVQNVYH